MGPCAGGAVYSPAMTDFVLMVEGSSYMFITGPDVVKTVTGEEVTLRGARRRGDARDQVRRRAPHARRRGGVLEDARYLLSFLPQNNREPAPYDEPADPVDREAPELDTLVPDEATKPYDMKRVIGLVVDDGEFLELQPRWAENIVCGFARLGGSSVGVVGNQPQALAGVLDIDSASKAARFVRTCDAFNIPLVTFVDVPGLPAGDGAGVGRDHPARREAPVRLLRGDGAEADGDHAEGVRRGLRRHELEAHPRRLQRRVADRRGRGDGAGGRGEHRLPQASSRRRTTRRRGGPS